MMGLISLSIAVWAWNHQTASPVAEQLVPDVPESADNTTPTTVERGATVSGAAADLGVFASSSPSLESIVRGRDRWYSVEDGALLESFDLLMWTVVEELGEYRSLAVGRSERERVVLLAESEGLLTIRDPLRPEAEVRSFALEGRATIGAINGDTWAVAVSSEDHVRMHTGTMLTPTQTLDLPRIPQSMAVVPPYVLATFDQPGDLAAGSDVGGLAASSTMFVTAAAHDVDGFGGWCEAALPAGKLVTTGDGRVHFTESERSWVVSPAADQLELGIDARSLEHDDREFVGQPSVRPIATGEGWSIVAHTRNEDGDERSVWTTTDGRLLLELDTPESPFSVGHVVWASIGAADGVGVRVSNFETSSGLLRIGDLWPQHPIPREVSRIETVERPNATVRLRDPLNCESLGAGGATPG